MSEPKFDDYEGYEFCEYCGVVMPCFAHLESPRGKRLTDKPAMSDYDFRSLVAAGAVDPISTVPAQDSLIRYGIMWQGLTEPICAVMPDGYWTPWHVAMAERDALRAQLEEAQKERDAFQQHAEVNEVEWHNALERAGKAEAQLEEARKAWADCGEKLNAGRIAHTALCDAMRALPRYAFDQDGSIYGPVDADTGTFIQNDDLTAVLALHGGKE